LPIGKGEDIFLARGMDSANLGLPLLRKGSRMSRLPAFKRFSSRPRLRIHRDDSEAVILPFSQVSRCAPGRAENRWSDRIDGIGSATATCPLPANRLTMDSLMRARVLHENRCCPRCRRGGVLPIDLGDGDNRHPSMPVPGSATLVGFFCTACGAEWGV
jgi:hypothetical protein